MKMLAKILPGGSAMNGEDPEAILPLMELEKNQLEGTC